MHDRLRSALDVIVCLLWILSASPVSGQMEADEGALLSGATGTISQYVVTGTLERRDERYVLTNDDGVLEAYVIPRKSLELDRYVGQFVELTVREPILPNRGEPKLWVDRIALPARAGRGTVRSASHVSDARGPLARADFSEPILGDEWLPPQTQTAVKEDCPSQICGPRGWFWGSAEFLYWRSNGMYLPPLVTTSPAGTPQAQAGVLGAPGTRILLGDEDIFEKELNGLRLRSGVWLDMENRYGIQGELFAFDTSDFDFQASNDTTGIAIIARPFFNVNPRNPITDALAPPAREDSQLVCYPRLVDGAVTVNATSELRSGSLALRTLLACEAFRDNRGTPSYSRVDLLAGYRYLQLKDHLAIADNFGSLDPDVPVEFQIFDQFDTSNEFHGADVGVVWQGGWRRVTLEGLLRASLGNVQQVVTIQGSTITTSGATSPEASAGGLLALPSNIGSYSQDRLAVIPELGINVGFQILPSLRVMAGYTFLYWGPVVRAGDQIDLDVNPDQVAPPVSPLVGALRPEFAFQEVDYWAQGLTFGLEGRW
ncbi:MAG: BBP7 family outer membrane beta-barrel protein [Pirellulaceae bacterium]